MRDRSAHDYNGTGGYYDFGVEVMPEIAPCCDEMRQHLTDAYDAPSFFVRQGEDVPRAAFDNKRYGAPVRYCPFCGKKIGVKH